MVHIVSLQNGDKRRIVASWPVNDQLCRRPANCGIFGRTSFELHLARVLLVANHILSTVVQGVCCHSQILILVIGPHPVLACPGCRVSRNLVDLFDIGCIAVEIFDRILFCLGTRLLHVLGLRYDL